MGIKCTIIILKPVFVAPRGQSPKLMKLLWLLFWYLWKVVCNMMLYMIYSVWLRISSNPADLNQFWKYFLEIPNKIYIFYRLQKWQGLGLACRNLEVGPTITSSASRSPTWLPACKSPIWPPASRSQHTTWQPPAASITL